MVTEIYNSTYAVILQAFYFRIFIENFVPCLWRPSIICGMWYNKKSGSELKSDLDKIKEARHAKDFDYRG